GVEHAILPGVERQVGDVPGEERVGLRPQGGGVGYVLGGERAVDQLVRRRAVVTAVVVRVQTRAREQWLGRRAAGAAEPGRNPARRRDIPDAALRGRRLVQVLAVEVRWCGEHQRDLEAGGVEARLERLTEARANAAVRREEPDPNSVSVTGLGEQLL